MKHIRMNKGAIVFCLAAAAGIVYYVFIYKTGSLKMDKEYEPDGKDRSKTEQPSMVKINTEGDYLPFYGYTIVSHVADLMKYEFIGNYISKAKTLSKYISPLPATSYHVTIFDIFSQKAVPEKYTPKSGSVPSEDWFEAIGALHSDLNAAQKICDHAEWDSYFWKSHFNIGKRMGRSLSIYGNVSNPDAVLELRRQSLLIFQTTRRPNLKYHLTLGYFYRDIAEEDEESFEKELDKLWKLLPDEYKLQRPNVCYFKTMEEFVPVASMISMARRASDNEKA